MPNEIPAYVAIRGVKGDPTGRQRMFQIYHDQNKGPSMSQYAWSMPYRDATDAENAARDSLRAMSVDPDEAVWGD